MSLENFIQSLPKADLNVQLEGSIQRETLALIAEQNDIAGTMKLKQFNHWLELYDRPEYDRVDEIARTIAGWLQYPEDLTRVVYDMGVSFSKQNVRYAEVLVSPALYTDNGMTFESFLEGLNDGRDRVERAWKVRMNWIITIPRDRPRKGDDIARWATSATARRNNVVGLGLSGREDIQPMGQFKKAFVTAQKRDMLTVSHARSYASTESIPEIVHELLPDRLADSWNFMQDEEAVSLILEKQLPIMATPTRELRLKRINKLTEYPMKALLDESILVILSASMPELYKTTLVDEYQAFAQMPGVGVDDIVEMSLNSIRHSAAPEEEKSALLAEFTASIAELRSEFAL